MRRVRASRYGFSLIEVLVVIAIVGLIAYSMLTSMGVAGQAELTRATNQTATTIRCAFDRARTTGYYYRMRFDFEQRSISLQRADDRMYMPSTDRDGEIVAFDPKKEKDREARDLRAAESYNRSLQSKIVDAGDVAMEGDEAAPYDPWAPQVKEVPRRKPPLFESFEEENTLSGIGEPIVFPEDVRILSVRTEHDREAITEGEAFLYFFPMGRTQLAHIQLRSEDGADEYTIKVQPLTGKVTVVPELEELELPDRVGEGEDELGEKQQRRSF